MQPNHIANQVQWPCLLGNRLVRTVIHAQLDLVGRSHAHFLVAGSIGYLPFEREDSHDSAAAQAGDLIFLRIAFGRSVIRVL